jgi:hypothetical protein
MTDLRRDPLVSKALVALLFAAAYLTDPLAYPGWGRS